MNIRWHNLLFLTVVFLVGCGSFSPPPSTRIPSETPTPISTELPVVATALPAGFNDDNPIQLVIIPADAEIATARLTEFEGLLQSLTDVTITVALAETQLEAAGLVCGSESGTVSVAWLDGMSAITNQLAGCGITAIQGETPDGTGQTGVLIMNIEFQEDGLASTIESEIPFCRTDVDDLFSWTLPVLFYGAEDFSVADIPAINELRDNDAIVDALMNGDCALAGMSELEWEAYLDADEDGSLDESTFVIATSPEIPYKAFSFSASLSLDAIGEIESALLQMDVSAGRSEPDSEATEEAPSSNVDVELMNAFFGEGALHAFDSSDLASVLEFFQASGINFAEFGN